MCARDVLAPLSWVYIIPKHLTRDIALFKIKPCTMKSVVVNIMSCGTNVIIGEHHTMPLVMFAPSLIYVSRRVMQHTSCPLCGFVNMDLLYNLHSNYAQGI